MAKRTGPTNPILRSAVENMRKRGGESSPFWNDIAEKLARSSRSKVEVNVSQISRNAKGNETIVVPGAVLSAGAIDKPVTVAAWRFSEEARKKIKGTGGATMTIEQLRKKNPKGTNVRIMV